jgi:hypothetical protein
MAKIKNKTKLGSQLPQNNNSPQKNPKKPSKITPLPPLGMVAHA